MKKDTIRSLILLLPIIAACGLVSSCDFFLNLFGERIYENPGDTTTSGTSAAITCVGADSGEITGSLSFVDQLGNPITGLNRLNMIVEESTDNINWLTIASGSL